MANDRATAGVHERIMLSKFDHECIGGHGPECVPEEQIVREGWSDLKGNPIVDAQTIAALDARRKEQDGAC